MFRLIWLTLGIGVGFVAAHVVDKSPRGHALLAKVDARITEFSGAVVDGYHGRERDLPGMYSDPTDPSDGTVAPH